MKNDFAVYIGRFQPFHFGHKHVLDQALKEASRVIIVIGSANCASNIKNPFTVDERIEMIRRSLPAEDFNRLHFAAARDYLYDDSKWVTEVHNRVHEIAGHDSKIALIGFHKDDSSYYLDLFPKWRFIHATPKNGFNATDIRNAYFEGKPVFTHVEAYLADWMREFKINARYENLCQEHQFIKKYKASWAKAPYDPVFITTDAVVVANNHVLVVQRKENPGKGLFALPGGFIKPSERIVDSMLRELKEETCILFPDQDLRSGIVQHHVFDHPGRSTRGRTVTHAYHIKLDEIHVPRVTGGDDAAKALWMPIRDIYHNENRFYEDHLHIIEFFVSRI